MYAKLIRNIPDKMKKALDKEQKKTGSSVSEIIRRAIRKYLNLK